MTDLQLDQLLKAAAPAPAVPPSFTRDVWRDIEHRNLADSRRTSWAGAFFDFLVLSKPRLAVWAIALGLGIFAGLRSGSSQADPVAVYAHSINPLAPALTP